MFTAPISPGAIRRAILAFGVLFGFSFATSYAALAASPVAVRVGPITAADPNIALAVRETLLTDLAKSDRLTLVGGTTSSSSATATSATYTLTGSCLFIDQTVIINLRMVNSAGHTIPGAADNVEGTRSDVFRLVQTLADRFTTRITGVAPVATEARQPAPNRPADERLSRPGAQSGGLSIPEVGAATPSLPDIVPDGRASTRKTAEPAHPHDDAATPDPGQDQERDSSVRSLPPPDQESDRARGSDRVRDDDRIRDSDPRPNPPARTDEGWRDREERPAHYTSVIIDARGLGLERSMSPKIRRTDGTTVYDGGTSSPDFAIEKGVVGYARTMRQARDMDRAGAHPLIIEAVDRHDQPLSSDPLISDEDADYLLRCARRDGFFKKFNVIFLIDK